MKKTLALFLTIALTACSRPTDPNAPKPDMALPAAAPPQIVVGEERRPIVDALTKNLVLERDKMEGISFYSTKNRDLLSSGLEAYISLPDTRLPLLRVKAQYFGRDWVFYDVIKVMADDVVVYERSFDHNDVHRDNSGGSVWETADYVAHDSDMDALKKIANAKSATIRFSGREHRDDHEISSAERKNLLEAISTYEKLTAQLQHS